MNKYLMVLAALCLTMAATAAVTTHLKLDCRTGVRVPSPEGEILRYDASWGENCVECRITDNGLLLTNDVSGTINWKPKSCSSTNHVLKLELLSLGEVVGVETAEFVTAPPTEEHAGVISRPAVAPTSTQPGMTAEIRCSCCGEIIQEATEIPPLGYIRNVTARQLLPHKKVEVCYTLADDIGEAVDEDVVLQLSVKDGEAARAVIGDTSCAPGLHRVVWDVEADGVSLTKGMSVWVAYGKSGPVHRWSFNGDLTDSVGGQTATIVGNVTTDGSKYKTPGGSSGSAYIDLGNWILPTNGLPFTIEMWVAQDAFVNWGRIYCWGSMPTEGYYQGYENYSSDCLQMRWDGVCTAENGVSLGSYDVGSEYHLAAVFSPIESGLWKVTYYKQSASDGRTINSVSADMKSGWTISSVKQTDMVLGQTLTGWDQCSENSYNELRIWNKAMTESELTESALAGCDAIFSMVRPVSAQIILPYETDHSFSINYSPIDAREVTVEIDDETVLSSAQSGSFVWQPRTKGEHVIKHVAGTNVWTRTVNVTSLVYEEPVPNPPAEDPNISISTTSKSFTKKGGKATITVTGSGTWTASASDDWIVLGAESGEVGSKNVSYQIAANAGVESRTGFIYVSGHVFTITQAGVGATLETDSAEIGMDGGVGRFTVSADAQATWRAQSDVDWISVETLVGTGATEVVYHVAPLNAVSTRSGTITAAGCTFTVNQTGRSMVLSAAAVTKDYRAHDVVVAVEAFATTAWGIALDAPWLSIVDPGPGQGSGAVTLALNENPSYVSRTATALIGTETLTITQTGRPTDALSFEISPEDTTASVKGANGLVAVTATPDLPWTATSQASWLTVMPGFSSGAGNGNVVYAASPNPTMAEREGTLLIAPTPVSGLSACVHTVVQPAATATVAKTSHEFAATGDSVAVDVAVGDNVAWTIVENADWISVDGALNRIGPGAVTLAVEPNPSIAGRSAEVTIAGHVFTVTQPGHGFTVMCLDFDEEPLSGCSFVFGPDDELEGYIDVTPAQDVEWIAEKDVSWIEFWENDYYETLDDDRIRGSGYGRIDFLVSDYDGADGPRTGVITIGDKKVFVTQRASDFDIDPNVTNVTGHAGTGVVTVPPSAGSDWDAIVSVPWLAILETSAGGSGSGVVRYSYSANETGAPRVGMIIIGGEEYEVRQAALQLAEVKVRSDGEGAVKVGDEVKVSGSGGRWKGSVDLGTSVTLTAVPADGWRFVGWERNGVAVGDGTPTLPVTVDADLEIVVIFERIPVYSVNGEIVREGEVRNFTAPEPVVLGGTTQLVCRGTSAFPEKGTSFSLTIAGDVAFEWDLWTTNFWVDVVQTAGGTISGTVAGGAPGGRPLPCWVEDGCEVMFEAVPAPGYSLMRWSVGASSVLVSAPLTVSAIFGVFDDTLATAADAPALAFRTGGDAAWLPVIDPTAEHGYSSVKSGVLGPESETWLETTVEGVGTLSFNWKADCEKDDSGAAEWDRLTVFTNGVEAARLDGTTAWRHVELPLSGAKTVIRWSFYRDDYDDPDPHFANCGWIDGVEFTK